MPSLPCTLQDLSNAQRAWASPVLPKTPLPPVTRLLRARAVSLRGIPDEMTAEGRGGGGRRRAGGSQRRIWGRRLILRCDRLILP